MLVLIRTISHSLRVRLFAAVLLVPLVALAAVTNEVGLRCRLTGVVLSACCCDGAEEGAAAKMQATATLSQADCCDRVVRDVTTAPAELNPAAARTIPARTIPPILFAYDGAAPQFVSSSLASRSEARDCIGPPTVRLRLVSKSAFLI